MASVPVPSVIASTPVVSAAEEMPLAPSGVPTTATASLSAAREKCWMLAMWDAFFASLRPVIAR